MKSYIKNTCQQFFSLFTMLTILGSCGSDGPVLTDKEAFIESITGTWAIDEESIVILDKQDITSRLVGFEIILDENLNYFTNSSDLILDILPWPSSGSFGINDELNEFTRDDGLIISVDLDASDVFSLSFQFSENFDDSTSGRTKGIRGGWDIKLNRK